MDLRSSAVDATAALAALVPDDGRDERAFAGKVLALMSDRICAEGSRNDITTEIAALLPGPPDETAEMYLTERTRLVYYVSNSYSGVLQAG